MNPSYEKSTFKIHLPSYLEFDDHVQISFKFEYKKGQTDKIIYSKAILSDRFGVEHSDEGHEHYFDVTKKMAQSMNISIHQDKKRIWMKNSRLQLMFLSETGEITNVVFAFGSDSKGKLLDVNYDTMRKEDETAFIKAVSDSLGNVKQKSLDVDGNKFTEDPKTIDNDIVGTDVTFGFHTAVDVATEAIDRIHTTAHSHSRVMVVEVMGHKAGWLGLYSALAGGGDVCLLPEIPYDINSVAKNVLARRDAGKEFSIVVVAEGALSKEEAKMDKKTFKKTRAEMVQSIGYRVAKELENATGLESRTSVLGYLQRGGTPSPYDRVLATQFGVAAADFLARGDFGQLVAMQNNQIVGIPLEDCAGKVKNIQLDDPLIATGRSVGICFGD